MKKKKIWVAPDSTGDEFVYSERPRRGIFGKWTLSPTCGFGMKKAGSCFRLRAGDIFRLTGRRLRWEDEPLPLTERHPAFAALMERTQWKTI